MPEPSTKGKRLLTKSTHETFWHKLNSNDQQLLPPAQIQMYTTITSVIILPSYHHSPSPKLLCQARRVQQSHDLP